MHLERDLVVDRGRILGRLDRWDIPVVKTRRCPGCGETIPVPDWKHHQSICHRIGWGAYRNSFARFTPVVRSRPSRNGMTNREFVDEVRQLLKGLNP